MDALVGTADGLPMADAAADIAVAAGPGFLCEFCGRRHTKCDARGIPARFCSDYCRGKAAYRARRGDADYRAANVARSARWYKHNAAMQCWRTVVRRSSLATPERLAVVESLRGRGHLDPNAVRAMFAAAGCPLPGDVGDVASVGSAVAPRAPTPGAAPTRVAPRDPFSLPSPDASALGPHLPGAACPLSLRDESGAPIAVDLRHGRMLHGLLTAVSGAPHDEFPRWALRPWGRGWAVVWRRAEHADLVACERRARWGVSGASAVFGARTLLRVPAPRAPGHHLARVDVVTPVVVREDSRGGYRASAPRAEHFAASLRRLARALGLDVPRGDIAVRVVSMQGATLATDLSFGRGDDARGKWGVGGRLPGWSGSAVLEVNAVARWLLDVAGRGWGLGGKVAAGFGCVVVTDGGMP